MLNSIDCLVVVVFFYFYKYFSTAFCTSRVLHRAVGVCARLLKRKGVSVLSLPHLAVNSTVMIMMIKKTSVCLDFMTVVSHACVHSIWFVSPPVHK